MHHGPLCPRSHTRVTICAASAPQGVGGLGQMGEKSGVIWSRRGMKGIGQPLCNQMDGLCGLAREPTLKPVARCEPIMLMSTLKHQSWSSTVIKRCYSYPSPARIKCTTALEQTCFCDGCAFCSPY